MPYISFTFQSNQDTQAWYFNDMLSTAANPNVPGDTGNPHPIGALNNGDVSGLLQCWAGQDGSGSITVYGDHAAQLFLAILHDGYAATYG